MGKIEERMAIKDKENLRNFIVLMLQKTVEELKTIPLSYLDILDDQPLQYCRFEFIEQNTRTILKMDLGFSLKQIEGLDG
jgi:hypothetical protein